MLNILLLRCFVITEEISFSNFIKKFFEYANGYQPSLKQRLDLFAMIPDDPEECRMNGLITKTLVYSLKGQQQ